jgi:DNA-binding NarL/FixJ family response regulator
MRKHLTERQKEVLRLACLPNMEIANKLFLSLPTVKAHFNNICNILTAANRVEALIKALKKNEIKLDEIEVE